MRRAPGARLVEWLRMFADPMALMLAGAAILYLLLGKTHEAILLALVIIPVLAVDVLMEARSRGALKKLSNAVAPRARVIRDGREIDVQTAELVPGDLLLIREGDVVHADGIVRRVANLEIDESQLTGESEPQDKAAYSGSPRSDLENRYRFFAGSIVLAGHGIGKITETGTRTRFGNIARLVAEANLESSPLQRKTARLARWLIGLAAGLSVAIFVVRWLSGAPLNEAFLYALSLAMSAVCEEVVLVMSLFVTLAALRLSRNGVLVKRLASVETLGATTVICMDKTGTLTAGRFALEAHRAPENGLGEDALLEAAALACEPGAVDSLEREILAHCRDHDVDVDALHARWRFVHDYPFETVGKHMSHVWMSTEPQARGLSARIVAKGAVEGILEHCELERNERGRVLAMNSALADEGMRVIAVAGRVAHPTNGEDRAAAGNSSAPATRIQCAQLPASSEGFSGVRGHDERGLDFYGLLGFRDPLRPEVPAAVAQCQLAGIKLKLITGDHALTAHAVAEAAGIAHDDALIVTGAEMGRLSPAQAAELARKASIFARVQPEQKYQIIDALVRAGEVVAMIGDGINDAPALRRAHIGVSMGRRGTEVARTAADLVLLEDNFAALVGTIGEGRRVYGNIQRALRYLVGFKSALVGLAILVPALGWPILLLPVDLVWLELIVHPVSALAFEGEPGPGDLMKRPPRNPTAPLIGHARIVRSALCGALLTGVTLAMYAARLGDGESYARAAAMAVVVLGSLALMWAELSGDRPWWRTPAPSRAAFWIILVAVAASLPVFMWTASIAALLQIELIRPADWVIAGLLALVPALWRLAGTGIPRGGGQWRSAKPPMGNRNPSGCRAS